MTVTFEELKEGLARYRVLQAFDDRLNFQLDNPPPPLPTVCRQCGKQYRDDNGGNWEDVEKTIAWMVKDGYQDWSLKGTCPDCDEVFEERWRKKMLAKGIIFAEEDEEEDEEE